MDRTLKDTITPDPNVFECDGTEGVAQHSIDLKNWILVTGYS